MILGFVTPEGDPVVELLVAGQTWQAVIDTGFNGDLELPLALQPYLNACYRAQVHSQLAGGQSILESEYTVEFPFDGETREAVGTFVPGEQLLLGTGLLRRHRLTIDFVDRTVFLKRVA